MKNASNVTIASSLPYANGLASFTTQFCLTPGTYTFIMNDSYGDGLSDPGNGSFDFKLLNGTILASGGGNFGFSITRTFTIN